MRSTKELKHLYDTQLKGDLAAMEKDRKVVKRFLILTFVIGFVFYILLKNIHNQGFVITLVVIGLLLVIFGLGYTAVKYYKYRKDFKEKVVSSVFQSETKK